MEPDLAILLTGAARVIADRLGAAVEEVGIADMRTPYGFVIRALADRDRTLTELSELLAVSKQAAIKVVDEMENRGFLTREPDEQDRRVKVLRLTDKGHGVRAAALGASAAIERELVDDLGDETVAAARRTLLALLGRHGGLEHARAGRSRALW